MTEHNNSNNEASFIQHTYCPACGSSDGNAFYSDGHTYCFVCGKHVQGNNNNTTMSDIPTTEQTSLNTDERRELSQWGVEGDISALPKRGISEETCRKWDYRVGVHNGKPVQIANYRNQAGNVVAQKLRYPNKDFLFLGDTKAVGLYGQHLWRDGGKMVVVTEGEIDALSVSLLQDNKWPVVSVPNGSNGAAKAIRKNLEWLEKFEKVIFMFDMDEPGKKAVAECAPLLSVGKAYVATLPCKDANECLVQGKGADVISAMWGAKQFRPDGIVGATEMWEAVINTPNIKSVPYPWAGMNRITKGCREGEIMTITAGSGIGKSQVCREIAHNLLNLGQTVGYVALEESVRRTALGIVGIELNKLLHLDITQVSQEELKSAFDRTIGTGRFYTYDHFGSIDSDNLINRIRFMARGCGCSFIILDHLSIVVSGIGDGDERRLIDNTMTILRSLVQELNIGLILVSHLKRPDGKGHEEGAATSLSQLRGSAAIAQLSDMVVGLERNQQDPNNANITIGRVLKNRFTGETGVAFALEYNPETGRLTETAIPDDEDDEESEKNGDF